MALSDFPWSLYLEAQKAQNQNQRNMNQDMQGIGQGLGQGLEGIGQAIQAHKMQQFLQELNQLKQTQGAPQQGPPLPPQGGIPPQSMGQVPPGQPMSAGPVGIGQDVQMPQMTPTAPPGPPMSGIGGPAQDNTQQIQSLLMKIDPQGMIKQMVEQNDPLKKAQMDLYKARADALKGGGGTGGKSTWYESPDGAISRTPTEGSFPVQLSDAQGMQYTAIPKSSKAKNEATGSRAEAMQRGIDVKQIDQLISKTGLTPKQQSVLQMNNQRAARAMQILSQPQITWQELALGEIDLTGIMQGGVPQRDEIIATHFPGWQENVAKWKTYASGHPTESVPPDIKNKVKDLVNGVVRVDNRILNANAKFAKSMIGPTIRGGLNKGQIKSIDEMTGVLTSGMGADMSTMSDDELRRVAGGK